MKKLIFENIGGEIDVVNIPTIDINGEGCSTKSLIEVTEKKVRESKVIYQNIWVVFDKDNFDDFDKAINAAVRKGYNVAWSNQSFEYWLYLHFYYSDASLHRDDWIKKLDEIFRKFDLGDKKYRKNYENIYSLVDTYGGVNTAIKYARRRMSEFDDAKEKPSAFDPGTTVYKLVEELKKFIDE